jgi:hypothetical protein
MTALVGPHAQLPSALPMSLTWWMYGTSSFITALPGLGAHSGPGGSQVLVVVAVAVAVGVIEGV